MRCERRDGFRGPECVAIAEIDSWRATVIADNPHIIIKYFCPKETRSFPSQIMVGGRFECGDNN
jgi:hypothetical protein